MCAEDVEGRRLVELGHYQGEEGVYPGEVDIGEKGPERPLWADEEDEKRPITSGGIMSGSMMPSSTILASGKRPRASRYASGVPNNTMTPSAIALAESEIQSGSRAPGGPRAARMECKERCWISTANGPSSASQMIRAPKSASTVEPRAAMRPALGNPGTTPVTARLPTGLVFLIRTRLYHPRSGTRSRRWQEGWLPACKRLWLR